MGRQWVKKVPHWAKLDMNNELVQVFIQIFRENDGLQCFVKTESG